VMAPPSPFKALLFFDPGSVSDDHPPIQNAVRPSNTLALSCGRSWRGPGASQGRDKGDRRLERLVIEAIYKTMAMSGSNPTNNHALTFNFTIS
jgi:hypothetical protein